MARTSHASSLPERKKNVDSSGTLETPPLFEDRGSPSRALSYQKQLPTEALSWAWSHPGRFLP